MAHYVLDEVLIHSVTWINLKSMRFKNKKDCDGGKVNVLYLYHNDS